MNETDHNVLLSMLPASVIERLGSALRIASAAAGDVLVDPGEAIVDLCFPLELVASIDHVIGNGDEGEPATPGVALVASEGVIGIEHFLGADRSLNRATVRIGGRVALVEAEAARTEFARAGVFHRLLLRSADYVFTQSCAIGACERVHPVEQRLIRWLLMFDDRARASDLALTQEVFRQLMGVRRVSVSAAARVLQFEGLIAYRRGVIMITDRAGLEAKSCSCYRAIKRRQDALHDRD